jgi:hypothetical protein
MLKFRFAQVALLTGSMAIALPVSLAEARGGGGGFHGGGGFGGGGFHGGDVGGGFQGGGARNAPMSINSSAGARGTGNYAGDRGNGSYSGNRTANVNNLSNTNNRNVNVNSGGCCGGYYRGGVYHPVAAGMAVGAAAAVTSAAIGSMVATLPADCSSYATYYDCGGTYYQPQYEGDDITYVVVDNPD